MAFPQPEQHPTAGGSPPRLTLLEGGHDVASPGAVWFTMCAWCERIRVRGRWIENERARKLIDRSSGPEQRLTHGICPSCFRQVSTQADRTRRLGGDAL